MAKQFKPKCLNINFNFSDDSSNDDDDSFKSVKMKFFPSKTVPNEKCHALRINQNGSDFLNMTSDLIIAASDRLSKMELSSVSEDLGPPITDSTWLCGGDADPTLYYTTVENKLDEKSSALKNVARSSVTHLVSHSPSTQDTVSIHHTFSDGDKENKPVTSGKPFSPKAVYKHVHSHDSNVETALQEINSRRIKEALTSKVSVTSKTGKYKENAASVPSRCQLQVTNIDQDEGIHEGVKSCQVPGHLLRRQLDFSSSSSPPPLCTARETRSDSSASSCAASHIKSDSCSSSHATEDTDLSSLSLLEVQDMSVQTSLLTEDCQKGQSGCNLNELCSESIADLSPSKVSEEKSPLEQNAEGRNLQYGGTSLYSSMYEAADVSVQTNLVEGLPKVSVYEVQDMSIQTSLLDSYPDGHQHNSSDEVDNICFKTNVLDNGDKKRINTESASVIFNCRINVENVSKFTGSVVSPGSTHLDKEYDLEKKCISNHTNLNQISKQNSNESCFTGVMKRKSVSEDLSVLVAASDSDEENVEENVQQGEETPDIVDESIISNSDTNNDDGDNSTVEDHDAPKGSDETEAGNSLLSRHMSDDRGSPLSRHESDHRGSSLSRRESDVRESPLGSRKNRRNMTTAQKIILAQSSHADVFKHCKAPKDITGNEFSTPKFHERQRRPQCSRPQCSDSSDDLDDDFENFLQKLKTPKTEKPKREEAPINEFIVDETDSAEDDNSGGNNNTLEDEDNDVDSEDEMFHVRIDRKINERGSETWRLPTRHKKTSDYHDSEGSDSDESGSVFSDSEEVAERQPDTVTKLSNPEIDHPVDQTPNRKPATASEFRLPCERPVRKQRSTEDFKTPSNVPRSLLQPATAPRIGGGAGLTDEAFFLKSLNLNYPPYMRHADAARYVSRFKETKHELAQKLFAMFNSSIFDHQLPKDLTIEWSSRYTKTAGTFYYKGTANNFIAKVTLSVKICDSPERVRDTVAHELCHAAVRLINGARESHGPVWKSWAKQINRKYPFMPVIARCHDYLINTKYTYQCVDCKYRIGRHSKSLDTDSKVCGHCHGKFEVFLTRDLNSSNEACKTPRTPRTPNGFALFVKESYSEVKKKNGTLKHGDIMKVLSKEFAEKNKISD